MLIAMKNIIVSSNVTNLIHICMKSKCCIALMQGNIFSRKKSRKTIFGHFKLWVLDLSRIVLLLYYNGTTDVFLQKWPLAAFGVKQLIRIGLFSYGLCYFRKYNFSGLWAFKHFDKKNKLKFNIWNSKL